MNSLAVKVRLRKPRRVFTFICNDTVLRRNDACIVQTERGPEWGVCILPPEAIPAEMEERHNMRVLRRADERDEETMAWMVAEERRAFDICRDRIERHRLPMKLVDVEVTFDKRKVIFLFTADDRIDFRELVRDLAHDLRTRIEMRHIQVRDEAGLVGGLGGCGRELCCSTWLNEFKPISMRMAKKQNLSLNPSKISGQCGRLLCCLAYENDQYEQAKKKRSARPEEAPPSQPPRRQIKEADAPDYDRLAAEARGENPADRPQRQDRQDRRRDGGQGGGGQQQRDRGPRQDRQDRGPRQDRQERGERPDRAPKQERGERAPREAQAPKEGITSEERPIETTEGREPRTVDKGAAPAAAQHHPEQTQQSRKRRGGRSRRKGGGGGGNPGGHGGPRPGGTTT